MTEDITYRRVWGLVLLELWLRCVHDNDQDFLNKLNDFRRVAA